MRRFPRRSQPGRRLTVGIPLHRSREWVHGIAENIDTFPPGTRVLISDATREDDALDRLQRRFRRRREVSFFDEPAAPGWCAHWNLLLARADTDYFAWLPHDDLVAAGYYQRLVDALDSHPSASLAWGPIYPIGAGAPPFFQAPPLRPGTDRPEYEAIALARHWNLGIPCHGVFRRAWARPLPSMPGERFADMVWGFGMGLSGHLISVVDAVYVKRFHPRITHNQWEPLTSTEFLDACVEQIRAGSPVRELAPDAETRLREAFADA